MKRFLSVGVILTLAFTAIANPVSIPVSASANPNIQPVFDQNNFRAVIIGDSQTTTSWAGRITSHYHDWDGTFVGEFLSSGHSAGGVSVNNIGLSNVIYRAIDPDDNWSDGGPGDHFSRGSSEWETLGDINAPGSFVGRYRVNVSATNTDAPWNYNWVENEDLVFRVAVRSGPNSIPAVELRPDRGTIGSGTVFDIDSSPGIQIFEIDVPASLNPTGTLVGGTISFPTGYIEENGQFLQVLGAYVGIKGDPNGLVVGYQGDSGWNLLRHIDTLSQESRVRLVEMLHLNTMIMIQGHNREWDNQPIFPVRAAQLMSMWDAAFDTAGFNRPKWVLVEPWRIQTGSWDGYQTIVENGLSMIAQFNRRAIHVRYGDLFNNLRPDEFDPIRYQLDTGLVHPGNVPSAAALGEDLETLIFGN